MSHFFNPIVVLQILKNLEMAPDNRGTVEEAFKDMSDSPEGSRAAYYQFLVNNDLVTGTNSTVGITFKGRILLRQAEILVFAEVK